MLHVCRRHFSGRHQNTPPVIPIAIEPVGGGRFIEDAEAPEYIGLVFPACRDAGCAHV